MFTFQLHVYTEYLIMGFYSLEGSVFLVQIFYAVQRTECWATMFPIPALLELSVVFMQLAKGSVERKT